MGEMYATGTGVAENLERTAELYDRACNNRHGEACYRLGVMYQHGTGVDRSPYRAASLIDRACRYGYEAGC